MAYDPETDIDPGGDIEGHAADQDLQDQLEQRQAGVSPATPPPSAFRQTQPGVYSPEAAPPQAALPSAALPRPRVDTRKGFELDTGERYGMHAPETVEQHPSWWHDAGQAIWQGTLSQGKDLVDATQFAAQQLQADPVVRQHLQGASEAIQQQIETSLDSMDPRRKNALSASALAYFGHNVDPQGNKIPTPGEVGWLNYFSMNAAQLVPPVLAAILPASLVGKVAVKGLSMLGVATKATEAATGLEVATRAAGITRTTAQAATTGGIFGGENAGAMFEYIHDELGKMKPAEKMNSPVYAELIGQGKSDAEATEAMSRSLAPFVYAAGAAGGLAGIGIGGAVAGKLGAAGAGRVAGAAIGGAEGALTMGGQGAANTALEQGFQQNVGKQQGYDYNAILANAVSQGLPGLVLGAGAGALHGRAKPAERPPGTSDVDPATAAALTAASEPSPAQGQLDLSGAPPGFPPGGTPGAQGEMFRTTEQANRPPGAPGTGLTEGVAPSPPPGPVSSRAGGMPGAVQADLPINRTPPVIVPTTGQGELYPSLPEANPPRPIVPPEGGGESAAPPAAQKAVAASKGKTQAASAPAAGVETKAQLLDELRTTPGVDPRSLVGQSRDQLKTMRDRLRTPSTETPGITTVVTGAEPKAPPPAPSERLGQAPSETAAPPAPGTSLPPAPEGAQAKPISEPTAEIPGGVRQEGGPASSHMAGVAPVTAEKAPPAAVAAVQVSKRAAQKAKMTGGVAVEQAKGHVEAPTAGVRETPNERANRIATQEQTLEAARTEAVDQVRDSLDRHTQNVIPLKKGDPAIQPAIQRALRDLVERVGRTDGTMELVTKAVGDWARAHPGRIPGTSESWFNIGDKIHRDMIGKGLPEREAFAREAGTMVERQPRGVESETQKRTAEREEATTTREQDIAREEAAPGEATETSAGATAERETVEAKVAKGTSADVRGRQLIERAIDPNDAMTPLEADRVFGGQNQGRGRKRLAANADIRVVARKMLAQAENKETEGRTLKDLAETQNNKLLTPKEKEVRTKALLEDLDKTSPERIEALQRFLREVEDPVGDAADKRAELRAKIDERAGKKPLTQRATPSGISPASSRYVQTYRDPRLNEFIRRDVEASEQHGVPYTLHDALRSIVNHSGVRVEMRPFWQLARSLLSRTRDIPVMSGEHALEQGYLQHPVEGAYGYYMPRAQGREHIGLGEGPHSVETILHEALHSVTHDRFEYLMDRDPNHSDLRAMGEILGELQRQFNAAGDIDPRLEDILTSATEHIHEAHSWLMTNPVLQAFAASRAASPEFVARMRELGFAPREAGRSVWRYFTDLVRKALGLGTPASASDYTLLDHLLRPLSETTERAAQFNERLLPKDPVLRQGATPLYHAVGDVARQTRDDFRREAPWLASAAMDRSRPAALAITNMDQIVPRYHDVFEPSEHVLMPAGNPLVRVRDAGEAISHRAKQFLDDKNTGVDTSNALIARAKSMAPAEQDAVAKLLNDATIANAHLAPGADNSHLTTPEQKATLADLQRRFAALSPEQREVEQKFVKIHSDIDKAELEAKIEGSLNTVFSEATEAQRTQFRTTMSTKDRLEAFLANPDTSALAKAYGAAWDDKYGDLTKLTAKAINAGWQRGDFIPLRRSGDYAVAYGDRGTPSEGLEMFETRGAAEERYAQLARDPAIKGTLRNVDFTRENALRTEMHNNPLVAQLDTALRKRPDLAPKADAIRDLMDKLLLEAATRSDASKLRRRGIQGASLDFTRTLAREVQDTAARVGHLAHGGERFKALADMRLVADDLAAHGEPGQSRIARQVVTEVEKHVTAQENPGGAVAVLARRAGTFGYMQSLASLSHIVTSTIENYSMAVPQLAARHGITQTTLELGRVGKSLVAPMLRIGGSNMMKALGNRLKESDWNVAGVMAKHLRESGFNGNHVNAVFGMLKRTGLIDHSYARELRRLANPEGLVSKTGRVVDYFNNLLSAWSHSVDAANRANVAMTAFNLEFRKTGDATKALAYAEERARTASPNYNLANKNRFSTSAGPLGGIAGPITQFKQYGFFAYGILGNAVKQSFARLPSEARTEARYAFAGMLATHALTAGAFTLIADPLRYIMGMYDWITGAQKPHDYQADLRGYLNNAVGKELGEFISRGAIDTIFGTSVHRRVGFANVLEIPSLESYDLAGVLKMVGTALVGASGEDATKFATGMQDMLQGDVYGGMKTMIPRPVRDAMTAYELATQGVKTQAGRTVLPPEQITPYDVAVQALGFQPSRVSEAREASAAVQQVRDEAKAEHTRLTQRWLQADSGERQNVMQEIRLFNQDPKHLGFRVTVDQLHKAQQEQHKRSQVPGAFGLRLPKKGAQELMQAGSFANI
jgi:hypothetical protein